MVKDRHIAESSMVIVVSGGGIWRFIEEIEFKAKADVIFVLKQNIASL